MSAYYNENDRAAVAWLRELIKAGAIADGVVDERSIEEVSAADVLGFRQCHWFAGIGGWSYALRLAGWPDDRAVWTGSCPCQPFSHAGRRAGFGDKRDLWPIWYELIRRCEPGIVFGEQVASGPGLEWLDRLFTDLENAGFTVGALDLCAAGVGALHNRPRLFTVAESGGARLERLAGDVDDGRQSGRLDEAPGRSARAASAADSDGAGLAAVSLLRGFSLHDSRGARSRLPMSGDRAVEDRSIWAGLEQIACEDGWRLVGSGVFPLAHGVSDRVGRLRGYGNAIVPQAAAAVIRAYLEIRGERGAA